MSNLFKKVAVVALLVATVVSASPVSPVVPTASAQTITELQAQLAALQAQLAALQGGASASAYVWTRNLTVGSVGEDVRQLQIFLNTHGAVIATVGAGSRGAETTYFGAKTKAALARWQAANAIAPAVGYFGPITRARVNAMMAVVVPVPVPTPVPTPVPPSGAFTVTLAADNPVAGTLIAGQAIADLAHFAFSNGTSAEVKVTNVVLKRVGVSADATLSSVYLFNGANRLTDNASVSSSTITFNSSAGLFTVPANSTVTIAVKANIATGTSGQTVGVMLQSYTKMGDTVANTVSISGNMHTIATATMAGVNFNATTTPAATTINAQADYTMWQNTVSITERDVWLKSIRFRQIGSVNNVDLNNFRLYVDGVLVATAANLDANGYLTFDLMATPFTLKTGSRIVKVVGDIVGGAGRTFILSLREAADVYAVDSQYGQPILAQANSTTFSARESGTQTIDTGTITFTKRTDSPSGNVVNEATNAVLAKYDVKAFGEAMKVESLRVRIDEDDGDTAYTLRNGAVYVNGVQVGSTAAIAGDTDATLAYTEYTFGSSFIVNAGATAVLEVRADVFDNDGTNNIAANDTIQVEVLGSSNVQRLSSLGFISAPATAVEGNTLTVATGSLTVAKNTAYADRTIVAPKVGYKLGEYNIQASTTEGTNITSIVVDWDENADAFDASSDLTNLYITIGSYTSPLKATISNSTTAGEVDRTTFATNVTVAAGQTVTVGVFADVATSATNGDATADTGESSIIVTHTTLNSATTTTEAEVDGQTITFGAGTFTTALDGASPLNRIVAGNQTVEAARYKFTSTNETYTVKQVKISVSSAAVGSAVSSVQVYDNTGATLLGSASLAQADDDTSTANTAALITGLNASVPANGSTTLIVKFVLNTIGVGAGTSQVNAAAQLDSVLYADSQGVEATSGTDRAGNEMYVYKSVPTINLVDLSNSSSLVNGSAQDLYKFTVAANSQGPIALKQFVLTTAWSDGGSADTLSVESFKLFEDGVDVTGNVVIQDQAGVDAEDGSNTSFNESDTGLTVSWNSALESVVAAGTTKTYTIRGVPTGFRLTGTDTVGDSVSFAFTGDTAHNGTKVFLNGTATATTIWGLHTSAAATGSGTLYNLIWSDSSAAGHVADPNASSTGDWANGYKVLNLDLSGETWNK